MKPSLPLTFTVSTVTLFTIISTSTPARAADPWYEIHRSYPQPTGNNLRFASAASLSGTTAVIGAWADDDLGKDAGAAYVINAQTGIQLFKLLAQDGSANDHFGQSVAINADLIIIGAPDDDDLGQSSGSAYVFNAQTGNQLFKFTSSDGQAGDQFGYSVALEGNLALIGAQLDDDHGAASGAAYLFDLTTGMEIRKITPADGLPGANFGNSVAIHNQTACIGAWTDEVNSTATGSAYIYDLQNDNLIYKLTPNDGNNFDFFGRAVALNDQFAVITADQADPLGLNSGAVYVFDLTTGLQIDKLIADNEDARDQFGTSVSLNGNLIIIGASAGDGPVTDCGSAYLFDITTGTQLRQFFVPDSKEYDYSGSALALSTDLAVIGAALNDDLANNAGSAYIFRTGGARLTVSPDPIIPGQDATFTITSALPNQQSFLTYSLKGPGSTTIPFLNIALDLTQPKQAGTPKTTDATGFVEWILPIPNLQSPKNIWLQGAQQNQVSNLVTTIINP